MQSDGNYSLVDMHDDTDGLLKRIEVYRASQPMDKYGITAAGSTAAAICGNDHLTERSNRIYRNLYSEGQSKGSLKALIESREELNPEGEPNGTWEVRSRDLDVDSPTFGELLRIKVRPKDQTKQEYVLTYELREPDADAELITSPVDIPVAEQASGLVDLGSDIEEIAPLSDRISESRIQFTVDENTTRSEIDDHLAPLRELQSDPDHQVQLENLQSYMRFGDHGRKTIHPGTNLTGEHSDVVSDYLVWREYRVMMALHARPFLPEMTSATDPIQGPLAPEDQNAMPGVYSLFVMANELNISLYELILDKIYSDYGGVPMSQSPGSRLETGVDPVVDASRGIKTVADIAEAFYLRPNNQGEDLTSSAHSAERVSGHGSDD